MTRKVTKPTIVCDKCGSELRSEEYDLFCDNCKMKITGNSFNVSIFWKDNKCGEDLEFCSLGCCRELLSKFPYNKKEVDFITLPYIHNIDDLKIFLGIT